MSPATSPPAPVPQKKPLLMCFSHLRWSFVWQRPQHLLSRAARQWRVIFVEEPLTAAIGQPKLDISTGPGAVTVAVPVLPEGMTPAARLEAQKRLVDELADEHGPVDVAWFYTPMALAFAGDVAANVVVYDCMDELAGFKGAPPELKRLERDLVERADVMFTGGVSLYEAKRHTHHNIHPFPSSIDRGHFASARAAATIEPDDQRDIPHPRVGFFGVVDERMDLDLVAGVADAMPDWQFVIIGPVVKIDPLSLPRRPNIHWLGGRTYDLLPAYLSGWDAGFMPFALNDATRFISPTKTPEFLAAGVPVVSTAVTDVVRGWGDRGLVEIGTDAADFAAKLRFLVERDRAPWLQQVDANLAGMSWDSTWAKMADIIIGCGEPRRSKPKRGPRVTSAAGTGVAHV